MKSYRLANKTDNRVTIAKPYLSVTETCEYLSLKKPTIYSYTSKKLIPFYKIGRKLLFKVTELNEFIENHRIATESEIKQKAISDLASE